MFSGMDYRREMIKNQLVSRGIKDKRVLASMLSVPRHKFVPAASMEDAYSDYPLPIGFEQTISQPYIVALMCQLCSLSGTSRVLEIGTGSGYQAAVLSNLVKEVYTVERNNSLFRQSLTLLDRMGYHNVQCIFGDGYDGYPEKAPFDAVIVSAAPESVPEQLKLQLAEDGRLVVPVGPSGSQRLLVITKRGTEFIKKSILRVVFVPMLKRTE